MAQDNIVKDNINIANARIGFRNFSGKEGQYNPQGNRNFAVFLDDIDQARELEAEGWNIRWLKPRDEDEEEQPMLNVKVAFGQYPPKIVLINTNNVATRMKEEDLSILDWADIKHVDLTIRPYNYNVRGKTGVKAYLKVMYVTIQADPWESKYDFENAPDSAQNIVCEPGYELIDGVCQIIED
jgi:hypothetical protein